MCLEPLIFNKQSLTNKQYHLAIYKDGLLVCPKVVMKFGFTQGESSQDLLARELEQLKWEPVSSVGQRVERFIMDARNGKYDY